MKNKRIQKYFEPFYSHSFDHKEYRPPLIMVGALYSRWGPKDSFSYQHKSYTSFNLITMGNAQYEQDGRSGMCIPGDVFIARKNSSQTFSTGSEGFLHKRSIIINGWATDMLLERAGLSHIDVVRPHTQMRITTLMREALQMMKNKPDGFVNRTSGIIYELILELSQGSSPDLPIELKRSINFIQQNLTDSPSLAQIAQAAGVSVRHCNRLFTQFLQKTPVRFMNDQRMAMAITMLTNSSHSIKQIAALAGFDDQFHFSVKFKKYYAMSPKKFREGR